ncbi:hypothetical protein B0H16DRAFT_1560547 [Mycena metata]|uniref:DUF6534 domain-containing protein n=1 Tax=Mycena metata TaxID=1033252 RepID=A0AAD7N3B9_9AGAR|nr:hypothetical protein B0H16DRAFT_1560547 [Mycena metata]
MFVCSARFCSGFVAFFYRVEVDPGLDSVIETRELDNPYWEFSQSRGLKREPRPAPRPRLSSRPFQMPSSSVDSVAEVLVVNVATVVGPVFIGNILNWMFMGTLVMQHTYYQNFPTDRIGVRILVYGLFLVDVAQTVILTHHGWFFIVDAWGRENLFDVVPWSSTMIPILCGFVAATVQIFYAWRIWMLTTSRIMHSVAVLIVLVALTQGLAAMITGFVSLKTPTQQNLIRLHPEFSIWLGGSFACDIMITVSMTYVLAAAKARTFWASSETMITRLINQIVQTGAATAICAAVDLALFIGVAHTNFHFVPAYILGKFYTNSLMLTLNLRRPTNALLDADLMTMNSFSIGKSQEPVAVHVNRDTHVETSRSFWAQKSHQTDENPSLQEHHVQIKADPARSV